jgi:glycosyltransferase involved in cell wall biosynthesis
MSEKIGWLVNDCLTCIPGTETWWHDMLRWFPNLQDKTNGYTSYPELADRIEKEYNEAEIKPDYIIRNGSYFRKLNINIPTFALIQDTQNNKMQTEVINSVDCVVFASKGGYKAYKDRISPKNVRVIEQSSDFNFWKPIKERHPDVLPNSIIFIGDCSYEKKGFHRVLNLITTMKDINFCLVMKDDTTLDIIPEDCRNRVKIFNKVDRNTVKLLINSCICGICTSGMEEGHFAGIEIGACNIPMVARPMGCYLDRINDAGQWGEVSSDENFAETIRNVIKNKDTYSPRKYYSKEYTLERCREKWESVVNDFVK